MKLLLISPKNTAPTFLDYKFCIEFSGKPKKANMAPLALPTLAALAPSHVEITLIDENVDPIDFNADVNLVGITFMTYLAPRAYEIADKFRKRNIPVVLGGVHPSMLPKEAKEHADAVVIGEAENIWGKVIEDVEKSLLQSFYKADSLPDLANSPIPRWDLLKKKAYLNFSIQTTRGCPHNCDFCSVKVFTGKSYRHKPVENVVNEVNFLMKTTGTNRIVFADDNIVANKKYSLQLFEALKPLQIKWTSQASVNIANDDILLKAAVESGLTHIFIGFESLSKENLKSVNKGVNQSKDYYSIVQKLRSYGINVAASFILGLDSDTQETVKDIVGFIKSTQVMGGMFSILTPYPGTVLFEKLQAQARILHTQWGHYTNNEVVFTPAGFSLKSLQRSYFELYKQCYSGQEMFRRLKKMKNETKKYSIPIKCFISVNLIQCLFRGKMGMLYEILLGIFNLWKNNISPEILILNLNFSDFTRTASKYYLKEMSV